jgi:diadenosine tetraphosphate (Ap4A) HIT family hydrolase
VHPGAHQSVEHFHVHVLPRKLDVAYSGDCDQPFRPKVITDSGDRDHATMPPIVSA